MNIKANLVKSMSKAQKQLFDQYESIETDINLSQSSSGSESP